MTAGEHRSRGDGYDDQTPPPPRYRAESTYGAGGGYYPAADQGGGWQELPPVGGDHGGWHYPQPAGDHGGWSYPQPPAEWPAGADYPTASFRRVEDPPPQPPPGEPVAPRRASGHRSVSRPGPTRPAGEPRRRRGRRGLPLWQEIPLLLVIAFCLAILVRSFLLQAFYIPSGSMEDTLIAGDRVLVNKVVYHFREPARGEVVVFQGTDAWAPIGAEDEDIGTLAEFGRTIGDLVGISRPGAKDYIKRVVGLPGDTVSCCDVDGRVFVNGQPLDEDYVIRNSPLDDVPPGDCRSRRFDEVVVQPGQMFVMGDHRQVSQDSRCQGEVPIDNVIGRAFVVVWPSDRWSGLPQPDTFLAVPQPAAPGDPAALSATLPAALPGTAHAAFVLPILLPVGLTFRGDSAGFRLIGRTRGRRLAE